MRCREKVNDVKTGFSCIDPGQVQGESAYCLSGIRHRGGASLIQALVWNLGTSRCGVKGAIQVGKTHKYLSTNTQHWDGLSRSSDEFSVMEKEPRGQIVSF